MKLKINLVVNQEPMKALPQWMILLISYNASFVNTGGDDLCSWKANPYCEGQEIFPFFDGDTNQF